MKNLYLCIFGVLFTLQSCRKEPAQQPITSNVIVGWGDSLTEGVGGNGTTYLTVLSSLTQLTTFNYGISGQTSTQIAARMLADTAVHKYPTIIWAGRNNIFQKEQIKSDVAKMVAALGHKRYLIISVTNGATPGEEKDSPNWQKIVNINADLAATYGDHFIDIRTYLVSQYDPNNAQDVIDHRNDIPPSSLRSSKLHLTARGYSLVAAYIYKKIDTLLKD